MVRVYKVPVLKPVMDVLMALSKAFPMNLVLLIFYLIWTTQFSSIAAFFHSQKTIKDVRIAYGVAGPVPMRAPSAAAKAKGKPLTKAVVHEFGQAVLEDINPRDSWRASKAFRQHIATVLAERALTESIRLAGGVIDE